MENEEMLYMVAKILEGMNKQLESLIVICNNQQKEIEELNKRIVNLERLAADNSAIEEQQRINEFYRTYKDWGDQYL